MRNTQNQTDVELVLDLGHGEYMPYDDEVSSVEVWNPLERDELYTEATFAVAAADYQRALPVWAKGHHCYDPTWCYVAAFTGPAEAMQRAWHRLYEQVAQEPSGDDDTFDYWPSGARALLELAADLDALDEGSRRADAARVIRDVLIAKGPDIERDLADKLPDLRRALLGLPYAG